jgi:hypothetical protein
MVRTGVPLCGCQQAIPRRDGTLHRLRQNRRRAFCRIVRPAPLLLSALETRSSSLPALPEAVADHPRHRRCEMSTIMKNKSLLLLPVGLAILIVIGILTS